MRKQARFLEALTNTKEKLQSVLYLCETRMKSTYFTRRSKMSFNDIINIILNCHKKTLQLELDDYFEKVKEVNMELSKQAFSEARQKISPRAFIILNDDVVKLVYRDDDFNKFRGYRLCAIDGTTLELHNSEELRNVYESAENGITKTARARVSGLYDIENDIMIDAQIGRYNTSEKEFALRNIQKLKEFGLKNDLILFDRGYPSSDLILELTDSGINYVIRIPSCFIKSTVSKMSSDDEIVDVIFKKRTIKTRIIKVLLESGIEEVLISSLFDPSFTKSDFKELYNKRWGIETKYDEFKNRLQLENFTGEKPIVIEQDFYASLYLLNMASLAKASANEQIDSANKDKILKYDYKVNVNILIGKLKDKMVIMLLEDDPIKRERIFEDIIQKITKNLVPIRPGRHFSHHKKHTRDKSPINKKHCM
jgi:hypothetical protein